jgi:demethylmenaquinone methyltransferase/2-methoxy-6-polyprenyl-1,4-benzoquinol methylase
MFTFAPGESHMSDPHKTHESEPSTHFGYRNVPESQKAERVAEVFHSVAAKYDLMNDVLSGGMHRLWKRFTIELSGVRPGHRILDIAGGTGDLARQFSRLVGERGEVVLADINASMLKVGRDRLMDRGVSGNMAFVQADAECLPFPDNHFDCVTIAFGLRNVTHKEDALRSMLRVLKPGGRLLVLEFSKTRNPILGKLYDAYSFGFMPLAGKLITNDADSYRYLAESIRMHPDQETLKGMMAKAGFDRVTYHNMTGGIVALHRGIKP